MNNIIRDIFDNAWIEMLLRWVIGFTFILASFYKILHPAQFAEIIYGYFLFPDITIHLIAIIVPFLELVTGITLVLGIYPRAAALIGNFMFGVFIVVLSINLVRGLEFDCGCFTFSKTDTKTSINLILARDIFYLILGLHIITFRKRRKGCLKQTGSLFKNVNWVEN